MKKISLPDKFNVLKGLADNLQLDKQKIILAVFFALLIGYVDYAFIIKSQFRGLKNRETKITKLKNDIGALNKTLASMKDAKLHPVAEIKEAITEEKIASLLQDISDIANKNNVKIIQIKPSGESGGKTNEKIATPKEFSEMTLILDLICNYPALHNFISALESGNVLIIVQGIKISCDPNNYLQQNVNLVLKTYVKR